MCTLTFDMLAEPSCSLVTGSLSNSYFHAAYGNGREHQGNMERSSGMPMLATTCWPTVLPVPGQPPASTDPISMLLISSASMSLGTVPLPVR